MFHPVGKRSILLQNLPKGLIVGTFCVHINICIGKSAMVTATFKIWSRSNGWYVLPSRIVCHNKIDYTYIP
jgi:hypothetical protein